MSATMMKGNGWLQQAKLLVLGLLISLSVACTTVQTRTMKTLPAKPAPGTNIIVLKPDIELTLLTAAGLQEPNSQWSNQATMHINTSLRSALSQRQQTFVPVDPSTITTGRANQVLRLHDAVATSILAFNYGFQSLPTRRSTDFNWTLGPGALELARLEAGNSEAKYALITVGRGTYSSGGRWAMAIVGAAVGASVPMGGQQVYASLVELSTGNIVWFNVASAGPQDDMRRPEGANALITTLLKDVPL
jgi:hypothetical protein